MTFTHHDEADAREGFAAAAAHYRRGLRSGTRMVVGGRGAGGEW